MSISWFIVPGENGPGQFPVAVDVTIDFPRLNNAKVRDNFTHIASSEEFCAAVGRAVLSWSDFERKFNELFVALMNNSAEEDRLNPRGLRNFEKRLVRVRKEIIAQFEQHPSLRDYAIHFLEGISRLQRSRNHIVHGETKVRTNIDVKTPTEATVTLLLLATTRSHGKISEMVFSLEDLDDLYYDLGHLGGWLSAFADVTYVKHLPIAAEAQVALEAFLRAHHPTYRQPVPA